MSRVLLALFGIPRERVNRLLAVMLERGIITRKRVDLLLGWRHNAGFNVHAGGHIFGNHEESIENLAKYMSRATLSLYWYIFF